MLVGGGEFCVGDRVMFGADHNDIFGIVGAVEPGGFRYEHDPSCLTNLGGTFWIERWTLSRDEVVRDLVRVLRA